MRDGIVYRANGDDVEMSPIPQIALGDNVGQGSFGCVYVNSNDTTQVVKTLKRRQDFEREYERMEAVAGHNNVIQAIWYDEVNESEYWILLPRLRNSVREILNGGCGVTRITIVTFEGNFCFSTPDRVRKNFDALEDI